MAGIRGQSFEADDQRVGLPEFGLISVSCRQSRQAALGEIGRPDKRGGLKVAWLPVLQLHWPLATGH